MWNSMIICDMTSCGLTLFEMTRHMMWLIFFSASSINYHEWMLTLCLCDSHDVGLPTQDHCDWLPRKGVYSVSGDGAVNRTSCRGTYVRTVYIILKRLTPTNCCVCVLFHVHSLLYFCSAFLTQYLHFYQFGAHGSSPLLTNDCCIHLSFVFLSLWRPFSPLLLPLLSVSHIFFPIWDCFPIIQLIYYSSASCLRLDSLLISN